MKYLDYLPAIFLMLAPAAYAADEVVLYKKVDKDGKVTFTDKPIPGSQEVKINTGINVVETPKVKPQEKKQPEEPAPEEPVYSVFSIDSPKQGDEVINADGNVTLIIGITPRLKPEHQLQLRLNGKNHGSPQNSPYFNVRQLDAGRHKAEVVVIDKESGQQLQTTSAVSFSFTKPSTGNQ
ncbi:DUF4124 domain-containing protein [Kangiella sediminilitoris]|uniref:DUF4124 domain-containing protein n=1 Tax=Kangiella sediminilitoris TaxID=1144748 RepID=A0A1B3B8B8_9GAMM|nr:DUF4124 domain-containing protein [Kangiella sediminilitoris]AOE49049.1 hypothetical protein KS2013_323 [Kangiella sediminilitoris]